MPDLGESAMNKLLEVKVLLGLLESMNIGVVFIDPEEIVRYCNVAALSMKNLNPDLILDKRLQDCYPAEIREEVNNILKQIREKKVPNWQKITVRDEPYLEHMISTVIAPDGEFLGMVMVILDVTSQKELTERLQKSERELTALFKASHTISSSLNLNDVLFKILLLAGDVISFSSGTIYLVDEEREQLVPMATMDCLVGERNPEPIGYHTPDNVIAFAVRSGEMVTLERGKAAFAQVNKRPNTKVVLILPLKDQVRSLGVLVVESEDQNIFRLEAQELLNTFANHAAVAIRNAQLFAQTKQMAIMDGLTKLYNRQYFDQVMGQTLAQNKRKDSNLSIIMVDVNDLKFINDYFGHVIGDYVITAAAQILQRSVREADTVCRYGGDELVILLPETSESEALIIHKRIRENVVKWNKEENIHSDVRLSLSIGCATAHGNDGFSDILARADQKMYEEKRRYKQGIYEENDVERAKKFYYSN